MSTTTSWTSMACHRHSQFEQSNDTVFGWEARVGWQITEQARVEAYYGRSDYAAQSATGFESAQAGLFFRYRF
jgi:hypothetical protein